MRFVSSLLALGLVGSALADPSARDISTRMRERGMTQLGAFSLLRELTTDIGPRLSGSPNAARAVQWGKATMERLGFQNVHLVPCTVPHWVRGDVESCTATDAFGSFNLTCCALGMSPGTPAEGVTGEVIEVHSLDEVGKLGDRAKGKIIFFNRPFDPTLLNSFEQYGAAGDQRFAGPSVAAKAGAIGAITRSLTNDPDDVPHTGVTQAPGIPCAALSIVAAERLSQAIKSGKVTVNLKLSCQTLPDEPSASVVGELTGTEKPNEIVVMGGHLDSWDKGRGAHDDGTGVCHSLEALSLLKEAGLRPKRTIRVVLFMNEEISGTGSQAYAADTLRLKEKTIAALESDSGGFAPRFFGSSSRNMRKMNSWVKYLAPFEIDGIRPGGDGADIGALGKQGAVLFDLIPESQRYFDYHHSEKDTLDKVSPRELELGSLAMATLVWLLTEEGT